MPFRCRPVIPLAGWRQQQQGAVTAGQCFTGFLKSLCRQGQADLIGLEIKAQGLKKGLRRCAVQPGPTLTWSVQANPLTANRLGIWLIDSIRFTCCPSAKLMQI